MKEFSQHEEALESAGHRRVQEVVKSLPEEALSMAWRSTLNERIRAEAAKKRRRQLWSFTLGPTFGAAATCAIAFVMFNTNAGTPASTAANSGLEAALVRTHRQFDAVPDVTGSGLGVGEAQNVTRGPVDTTDWNEADIESL